MNEQQHFVPDEALHGWNIIPGNAIAQAWYMNAVSLATL